MKILFIHQNFPAQFLHLAPALRARGHEVMVLTDQANQRENGFRTFRYLYEAPVADPAATRLGRNYTQMSDRGVAVARAANQLCNQHGYRPDVIFGHSGWGETLFLKEIWPEAKLIVYAEFYYRGIGRDIGFDPEFSRSGLDQIMIAQSRSAHLGAALLHADAALSPTQWQADAHPSLVRPIQEVIFDGIDTDRVRPNPQAQFSLPNGKIVRAGDEVLTFVNRNLEPYRGFHIFMRALPEVLRARPNAQVVLVGGEDVSYGPRPNPTQGASWKAVMLKEVGDQLDLSRVHFTGKISYENYLSLLQVSRVHAYLTYPFVLSWSCLEAMAAGCLVIGSDTAPVCEVLRDKENGLLVDFFNVKGWSTHLIDALAHPEKYLRLREKARQDMIDRYDLRRICLPKMINFVESFAPDRGESLKSKPKATKARASSQPAKA